MVIKKPLYFNVSSLLAFVAATAVPMAFTRSDWGSHFETLKKGGEAYTNFISFMFFSRYLICSFSYFLASWSVCSLILGVCQKRVPLHKFFRQPGMAACLVVTVILIIRFFNASFALIFDYMWFPGMGFRDYFESLGLLLYVPSEIGCAVIATWILQISSGRWRPDAHWLDRTGRFLGFIWIFTIPFSWFTWNG